MTRARLVTGSWREQSELAAVFVVFLSITPTRKSFWIAVQPTLSPTPRLEAVYRQISLLVIATVFKQTTRARSTALFLNSILAWILRVALSTLSPLQQRRAV